MMTMTLLFRKYISLFQLQQGKLHCFSVSMKQLAQHNHTLVADGTGKGYKVIVAGIIKFNTVDGGCMSYNILLIWPDARNGCSSMHSKAERKYLRMTCFSFIVQYKLEWQKKAGSFGLYIKQVSYLFPGASDQRSGSFAHTFQDDAV